MTIGALSERTGVNIETIRYYERINLLPAPPRTADAPEEARSFVYLQPQPGTIFMWESWLRHEVPANAAKTPRISISFNYGWR